jgi:peptide-methionine (R)-S-oxide reductase
MSDLRKPRDVVARPDPVQSGVTPHFEQARSERQLHNHAPGVYVDLVSGEALFASSDMYESGTRWLNFSKPIDPANISEVQSTSNGMTRTEVRSVRGNSHLGHIFLDGPPDRGGLRYCIHSASVRFVPREQMEAEGYGVYLDHLEGEL